MPSITAKRPIQVRGPYTIQKFPEAASQSFGAMTDICTITTSGTVNQTITAGNALASTGVERGIVIPTEPASGTTGNMVECIVPGEGFQMLLPTDDVTAQADVGLAAVLLNSSSDPVGWAFDKGTTSNPIARSAEIDRRYPVGEDNGYQWVELLDTCRFPIT